MNIQRDSSFPTIGHEDILNKLNTKSKTNRKRTNIDNNYNKPQQKHRLGTVNNKLLRGGGRKGLTGVVRCNNLILASDVVHIHIVQSARRTSTHQCIKTANI